MVKRDDKTLERENSTLKLRLLEKGKEVESSRIWRTYMPHKEQEFTLSKGVITLAALSRKEWKRQKEM